MCLQLVVDDSETATDIPSRHVAIFNGLYDPLVWIPVLIWVAERFFRLGRILLFNPWFWNTRAEASFDADSNIVRLKVPLSSSAISFPPGTYCYLMLLKDKTFWQSHPFTIASVHSPSGKQISDDVNELGPLLRSSYDTDHSTVSSTEGKGKTATFLIRPYDQFTGRLRDLAMEKSASLPVILEGPYGQTRPLHLFGRVLFITGGSGIAIPLSYLRALAGVDSRVTQVEIHWAVREPAFAASIINGDCSDVLGDERFSMFTYMRRGDEARSTVREASSRVQVRGSRLDCEGEVAAAIRECGFGSLAVVCCGPSSMADDCRAAVARHIEDARGRVRYFEESYTW